MNIETLLAPKKKAIIKKWIDQVLDSYGAPDFFKKQKDRFANPIGGTISDGLQELYAILLEERELGEAARSLEQIIKIRAVQDFTPSQAVSFVYLLHQIRVNEVLSGRHTLTDGTKCVSAMLKSRKIESADKSKINRLT